MRAFQGQPFCARPLLPVAADMRTTPHAHPWRMRVPRPVAHALVLAAPLPTHVARPHAAVADGVAPPPMQPRRRCFSCVPPFPPGGTILRVTTRPVFMRSPAEDVRRRGGGAETGTPNADR